MTLPPASQFVAHAPPRRLRDDVAYILPMAAFLGLTQVGGWFSSLYTASYAVKTLLTAGLLAYLWPHYSKISWKHWQWGVLLGVIGVLQWVGMERLLLHLWPHYVRLATVERPYDPTQEIHSLAWRWAFITIRWGGATLLVPVMEELFWRDWLWRTSLAPNDFKLAEVGEYDGKTLLLVSALFCFVHVQWMTAIVWGLMIGGLLIFTQSLGACIVMHSVTNFLLGLYVLKTGDWQFW